MATQQSTLHTGSLHGGGGGARVAWMHVPGKRGAYWTRYYWKLLTRRKIHDASEILPKTPDSASWAVRAGLLATVVTFMIASRCRRCQERVEIGVVPDRRPRQRRTAAGPRTKKKKLETTSDWDGMGDCSGKYDAGGRGCRGDWRVGDGRNVKAARVAPLVFSCRWSRTGPVVCWRWGPREGIVYAETGTRHVACKRLRERAAQSRTARADTKGQRGGGRGQQQALRLRAWAGCLLGLPRCPLRLDCTKRRRGFAGSAPCSNTGSACA